MIVKDSEFTFIGREKSYPTQHGLFVDKDLTKWHIKVASAGCFMRYQVSPDCMKDNFKYRRSTDYKTYRNIGAIWEVFFADLAAQIIPCRVPEYRLLQSRKFFSRNADLLIASRDIEGFKSISSHQGFDDDKYQDGPPTDFSNKHIKGFYEVWLVSQFLADIDVVSGHNTSLILQADFSFETSRIDFAFAGWFAARVDNDPRPGVTDCGDKLIKFRHSDVPNFYSHLFERSLFPSDEKPNILNKLATFDPQIFQATWDKYKPYLLEQAHRLKDGYEQAGIRWFVQKDMPVIILTERQLSLQTALAKKGEATSYHKSSSYEDWLESERNSRKSWQIRELKRKRAEQRKESAQRS